MLVINMFLLVLLISLTVFFFLVHRACLVLLDPKVLLVVLELL